MTDIKCCCPVLAWNRFGNIRIPGNLTANEKSVCITFDFRSSHCYVLFVDVTVIYVHNETNITV